MHGRYDDDMRSHLDAQAERRDHFGHCRLPISLDDANGIALAARACTERRDRLVSGTSRGNDAARWIATANAAAAYYIKPKLMISQPAAVLS